MTGGCTHASQLAKVLSVERLAPYLRAANGDFAQAVRRRVAQLRRGETPGRVIAELNLGFWRFLLAKRYEETLWTGTLRHAFPHLLPLIAARSH